MKKIIFASIVSFLYSLSIYAQLSLEHNAIRQGDELVKYQVEYKDPGKSGEDLIWDFSNLKTLNEEYTITYSNAPLINDSLYILGYNSFPKSEVGENDLLLVASEHNTLYYYHQRGDSLLLLGHENPVVKLQYKKPLAMMVYPVSFGKTVSSHYVAQGIYSGLDTINTQGIVETTADALGKMVFPTGDTINSVLRVKTSQQIFDQAVRDKSDFTKDGKVLETFRWYTKGYRYPIFETVRNLDLKDSTLLFGTCFYFPLQDHFYLEHDSKNQEVLGEIWSAEERMRLGMFWGDGTGKPSAQGSEKKENQLDKLEDYITYTIYPNPVDTELNISYTIHDEATISFELYYASGSLVKKITRTNQSAGNHRETINCSNLSQGLYVLHIKANNAFRNEKIIKK